MNKELTLLLDDRLIASAERHASETGRSVSALVADFFALLGADGPSAEIAPRTRSLRGILVPSSPDATDHQRYLEEKVRVTVLFGTDGCVIPCWQVRRLFWER